MDMGTLVTWPVHNRSCITGRKAHCGWGECVFSICQPYWLLYRGPCVTQAHCSQSVRCMRYAVYMPTVILNGGYKCRSAWLLKYNIVGLESLQTCKHRKHGFLFFFSLQELRSGVRCSSEKNRVVTTILDFHYMENSRARPPLQILNRLLRCWVILKQRYR